MNAGQAIAVAREWVELYGSQTPGFCGAHLMGSLTRLPYDAPVPAFSDVDFNIISSEAQQEETHDVSYKGVILEYGVFPLAQYQSAETVLANPVLASNIAAPSSLVDPLGILNDLHNAVASEYARRIWVQARCEQEKQTILSLLAAAGQAPSSLERMTVFKLALVDLAGLLMVARIQPPTHRRSLVLMRNLLQAAGRLDLHERALTILGYASMDRAEVEFCLQQAAAAFDCAVKFHRSPTPFDFKLQPHIKPYFVAGSQQMIDEGFPREAMVWIEGCSLISRFAITADAPPDVQQKFASDFQSFIDRSGLATPESSQLHIEQAHALAADLFALADQWVAALPS